MKTMDELRVLPFEGIHNFRDCGGYATQDGRRVRLGQLYRSAQYMDATGDDLARFSELGLAAVIDLRNDKERETTPCPRPDGFAAQVHFISDNEVEAAPHIQVFQGLKNPEAAFSRMVDIYKTIPYRPTFIKAMHRYFHTLAESDGPVLIHCMAGKDRTGVAVAVLHRILGVAQEDWMADYMITNVASNIDGRLAAWVTNMRDAIGPDITDDTVRVVLSVQPEYIQSCFATIDERHGNLGRYLDACGIEEGLVGRVRDRLIE